MIAELCSNVCGPGCLGPPCAFVSVRTPTLTDKHSVGWPGTFSKGKHTQYRNKEQVSSMFVLGCLWIYESSVSEWINPCCWFRCSSTCTCMCVFERRANWLGIQWKPCLNILCCIIWAAPSHLADCQLGCCSGGILRLPCLSHHKAMWYLHGLACLPWQPERKGGEGSAAAWDSSSTGVKHTSLPTHTHTDTWKPNAPARVGYGGWLCQYWLFCEDDTGTCWLFIFWLHCQVSGLFLR